MKYHIITDTGDRLFNLTRKGQESVAFDMLVGADAVLVVRQGITKDIAIAALREIEGYVKKDL